MVPRAILMKSGLVSVNIARQVNAAHSKTTVNAARPMDKNVNTARLKVVVNAVKGNNVNVVKASAFWVWKPKTKVLDHVSKHNSALITLNKFDHIDAQGRSNLDQGVINSRCSRHMTGNMSYLTDYEETDGGYVAFEGNPKGGKITGKDPKSSHDDESKPSSDDGKKVDEDLRKESECNDQEKEDNVNNTNNVNAASTNEDDEDNATQTRKMTKNLEKHGFVSTIQQRTNHKDLQNCLFACFLSQEEPKKVFRNKKDEREIMIKKIKQDWLLKGTHKKKGLTMMKSLPCSQELKQSGLFLAYASFKDFVVYQMDVKSAFLYGKIEEEVYVCQPPGFEDPDFPDRVYKVEKGTVWTTSSS
ncbi:putative ribonuclease H-like domain-containing protein [Tanacetum coccineum]